MDEQNRFKKVQFNKEDNVAKVIAAKAVKGVAAVGGIVLLAIKNKDNIKSAGQIAMNAFNKIKK